MSSKSFRSIFLASAALAAIAPGIASATPVNYYGAIFDLSIVDIGSPGFIYEVTYKADFTGFTNGGAQPYIDAIAWKHAGADVSLAALVSDPGFGWITSPDATVNAGGCSSNGGNTWACAQDYLPPYVPTSGVLSWVFFATFEHDLTSLNTTGDSIKAHFVNSYGDKQGALLSCTLNGNTNDNCTTTVNVVEPATIATFGLGLIAFGALVRRRTLISIR